MSVLDDNEKLKKCAQLLFWTLLVVLSFFVPLLLLHLCNWTNYKHPHKPITSTSEIKQQVQNVNILVFTLMESVEYWYLIKDKMSESYLNELESMHLVRFTHIDIEYNFDDSFDFKEYIKCPEVWNKFDIFNANKTREIQRLCGEYDGVLIIQQYFASLYNADLSKYFILTDEHLNVLLDGCKYESIPLIITSENEKQNDGKAGMDVLEIDELVNADREIVFRFDDESFHVLTEAVLKLLS